MGKCGYNLRLQPLALHIYTAYGILGHSCPSRLASSPCERSNKGYRSTSLKARATSSPEIRKVIIQAIQIKVWRIHEHLFSKNKTLISLRLAPSRWIHTPTIRRPSAETIQDRKPLHLPWIAMRHVSAERRTAARATHPK